MKVSADLRTKRHLAKGVNAEKTIAKEAENHQHNSENRQLVNFTSKFDCDIGI